jgi:hypothetical protein
VEDETICVVVVIADVDAKSTLNALLNSARCPNRLSICVVSNIPQPTATEHPNVRVSVTNTSDFAARTMRHHRYAIRHMYVKERFIMFAPLHGTYCEDWDAVLVESLRALPESSCLTERVSMRGKKPSFLAYADGGLLVPVVRSVPFGSNTGGCTELVCWTADFSFSTAAALLVSGVYGHATTFDADIGGEDSYISSQLWTSGVRFFTPPQSVVHRSEPPLKPIQARRLLANTEVVACHERMLARMQPAYCEFSGLRMIEDDRVSLRARLGLLSMDSTAEVLSKYGSWPEYERIRAILAEA